MESHKQKKYAPYGVSATLSIVKRSGAFLACIFILLLTSGVTILAQGPTPDDLLFRRQAVKRMVFDKSQQIPLSGMDPAKVVGLDVMHPPVGEQTGDVQLAIENGRLKLICKQQGVLRRWVGGFNPFAAYDLSVHRFAGTGRVGMMFRDSETGDHLSVGIIADEGNYVSVRLDILKDGLVAETRDFPLPVSLSGEKEVLLRVQMVAVGVNLFVEQGGTLTLIGRMDFVKYFDLRRKELMQRFSFCLFAAMRSGAETEINEASAFLAPGIGQSDVRNITYEDGSPFFKDGRIWILMSVRGGGLPHPMQGVFSLNPSVFDIRFEGLILYDRGDGLLRNDLASNIFFDRTANRWIGFTTGFSSYGDPEQKEKKEIWAVQSDAAPLQGISIMKAKPLNLVGDYEDPQCIYDPEARKWRMLLCEDHKGYKAVIREADQWDGNYQLISGPVEVNSTGTQIQRIGEKYYALFGSSERQVFIYSYPDLQPEGTLQIHLPPWDDRINTRVWPNVFPLPEGYPAPYMALMMDRLNYPGMTGHNWTYGAMYLYHGHIKQEE